MSHDIYVSIIIPVYNRLFELERAINSILKQTYQHFEIIVVDDGSADSIQGSIEKYNDNRIRLYRIPHSGVSSARNMGVANARYDYIAFLDSDDEWMPEKLAFQLEALSANPHYPVCFTGELWIRNGKSFPHEKSRKKYGGWIFEQCLIDCFVGCSTVVMKKSVFLETAGFDTHLPICEDYDLWLKISAKYPMLLLPQQLIHKYGGHADQLSNSMWGKDRFRIHALKNILKSGRLSDLYRKQAEAVFKKKCLVVSGGCLKRFRYKEFAYYFSMGQKITCLELLS
ncbi:glycosyltransferase family 2 protein [bacterium]|nr:glycosyltransferase family 2 protein [bacterium]MCP5462115.1 glycosyltransferase family 2 protein [bacterium]